MAQVRVRSHNVHQIKLRRRKHWSMALGSAFACFLLQALIQLTAKQQDIFSSIMQPVEALRFQAIHMPALVQRGTNFWLSCQFNLDHNQQLYSVKWYHNNEEFYRLIMAASAATTSPSGHLGHQSQGRSLLPVPDAGQATPPMASSIATGAIQGKDGAVFYQQYFAQMGVNVMMSQSNATHVRMLNASLDSEGQFACEISTQNLSTIRHEKELKVYVLPSAKLQVTGLKNRYAIGDRVELKCTSDFSKPMPILAWFINGQRISNELQDRWNMELELRNRSKSNEPRLVAMSLVLKFKLTHELVGTALASSNVGSDTSGSSGSKPLSLLGHNQSHSRQSSSSLKLGSSALKLQAKQSDGRRVAASEGPSDFLPAANFNSTRLSLIGALETLKLQCKYKLIEVSDVTFSELLLHQTHRPAAAKQMPKFQLEPEGVANDNEDGDNNNDDNNNNNDELRHHRNYKQRASFVAGPTTAQLLGRRRSTEAAGLDMMFNGQLFKTPAGQIGLHERHQRPAAPEAEAEQIWSDARPWTQNDTCHRLGSLALHPDDPVISGPRIKPPVSGGEMLSPSAVSRGDNNPGHLRLQVAVDDTLEANCSTLGGFVARISSLQQPNDNDDNSNNYNAPAARLAEQQPQTSQLHQATTRRGPSKSTDAPSAVCDDPLAWRKMLISGRHQTNELEPFVSALASTSARRQVFPVPIDLGHQAANAPNRQQVAYLSLGEYVASSTTNTNTNWQALNRVLSPAGLYAADSSLVNNNENTNHQATNQQQHQQILAPPLLEWFINYQEAPKSATSGYSPPLPLVRQATQTSDDAEGDRDQNDAIASPLSMSMSRQVDGGDGNNADDEAHRSSVRPTWQLDSPSSEGAIGATAGGAWARRNRQDASSDNFRPGEGTSELGAGQAMDSASMLPSVDYLKYFANLDQARPLNQHLGLRMQVDSGHFTTPDSLLRLRCSSTQALVLISDSVNLKIIGLPSNWGPNNSAGANANHRSANGGVWNQHRSSSLTPKQQQQHHGKQWRQKNSSNTANNNNNNRATAQNNHQDNSPPMAVDQRLAPIGSHATKGVMQSKTDAAILAIATLIATLILVSVDMM